MATTWSYTLLAEVMFPPGISGTLNVNKMIAISAVGPQTAVAAGNGLDVSSDLEHVAFGTCDALKAYADQQFLQRLLIASGNSGADLKVVTYRLGGSNVTVPSTISAGAVLTGAESRMMLYGWD